MGQGRRRRAYPVDPDQRHLLACPRVAPDWELSAVQALIKPQLRGPIQYRKAIQPWPRGAGEVATTLARHFSAELSRVAGGAIAPDMADWLDFPTAGEFRLVAAVADADLPFARGLAILLSKRLPGLWFVVDRLFVRDGRFYRRQYGFKLNLVEARNIHLPGPIRAAVSATIRTLD